MSQSLRAHGALLFATFIFGANYWISKSLMPDYLHPFQIIFFRTTVSAALFWLISLFFPREPIQKRDWGLIIFCGFIGIAVNQTLFFSGLNLTSPIDASIIHVANPVLVLLFSFLLKRENITRLKVAGMLLGAAGAVFIVLYGKMDQAGEGTVEGNLLISLNIICWALYLVLVKPLMHRYSTITVMKWLFLFGTLFALPVSLPSMQHVAWQALLPETWAALAYVVIGNTVIAYFITNYALKTLSPSATSYYIFLQPLIVVLIAVILGSGVLTGLKALAGLVIMTGAWLVSRNVKASLQV
jgi:drug/metabolite transporter (DMT)-like permease